MSMKINRKEREILRALAKRVAGIADLSEQEIRRDRWFKHNSFKKGRPLVLCFPENSWQELLPDTVLEITHPLLREWEWLLRVRIYEWEYIRHDAPFEKIFQIPYVYTDTGWGLSQEYIYSSEKRGSYRWISPIKETEDIDKLKIPQIIVDRNKTEDNFNIAMDIFGDILKVGIGGGWWWSLGLIGTLANLRGLDQVMIDIVDRPEWVHKAMNFLMTGTMNKLHFLEKEGILSLNNRGHYVGSGGFGYTNELPAEGFDGKNVRLCDLWGFAEAQEFALVSPAMFEEFVLQYQIPLLEKFGLNCYGCCESLTDKFEILKRRVPRLRRISVSPWADLKIAANSLQDKYILSWKPNPAYLASNFDTDRIRKMIREGLEITKDCVLEIVMKDVTTVDNKPERITKWVQIAQETVNEFYK